MNVRIDSDLHYFINKLLEEYEETVNGHPENYVRQDINILALNEVSENISARLTYMAKQFTCRPLYTVQHLYSFKVV